MEDLNRTQLLIREQMNDAVIKAWEALSGYKFWMFGYHAGRWVNYNRLLAAPDRQPNPFRSVVMVAREKIDTAESQDLAANQGRKGI